MEVSSAATAHQSLFLAAMQSEKQQQAAILQVVSDATEQAAQIAKSAPSPSQGQNVDLSV